MHDTNINSIYCPFKVRERLLMAVYVWKVLNVKMLLQNITHSFHSAFGSFHPSIYTVYPRSDQYCTWFNPFLFIRGLSCLAVFRPHYL
jgi:hypothetical protein